MVLQCAQLEVPAALDSGYFRDLAAARVAAAKRGEDTSWPSEWLVSIDVAEQARAALAVRALRKLSRIRVPRFLARRTDRRKLAETMSNEERVDMHGEKASRAEAERHIAEHSLGEAARIGRLSRIREFVLGAQDGLLVPLGVVTGMAAAHPARSLIIVAGLAEAVAGAISMGGGSYLASKAEEQLYASEIAAEGREIDEFPERETAELAVVLEREGLSRQRAETVARGLASNPNVFLRTKVEKELGLSADGGSAALGDAVVVGVTYLGAAVVPLWPYFFFSLNRALVASLVCTLLALFSVGAAKGRITRLSLLRSGLQVMIIGSISAGVGFAIGHLVTALAG